MARQQQKYKDESYFQRLFFLSRLTGRAVIFGDKSKDKGLPCTAFLLTFDLTLSLLTMASFVPIATTLLVRERAGLVVYAGPPSITPDGGTLPSVSPIEVPTITGASVRLPPLYSPDGQYLALVKETITLHSPTGELVSEILCSDASSIEFSPRSSFLLTWSKPTSAGTAAGSAPEGNLKVWETASGRLLTSFFQKSFKRDAVQFTSDERFYCRAVNNEVHILNAADFTAGILTKVYHKGVTQFKISPVAAPDSATSSSSSYVVVVFNAEAGGNPARATLYKFSPERMTVDGPVSSRYNNLRVLSLVTSMSAMPS